MTNAFLSSPPRRLPLPLAMRVRMHRLGHLPTRFVLYVSVQAQRLRILQREPPMPGRVSYKLLGELPISTSRFGVGQTVNSYQTPLGLHRIAAKIGLGHPGGSVFQGRKCVGLTWQGRPNATIVHRILWLEGLDPGLNRGGSVDSFQRYIYIHGFSDESTLGRPFSYGCIHMAARDLIPLSETISCRSLVWIAAAFTDGPYR